MMRARGASSLLLTALLLTTGLACGRRADAPPRQDSAPPAPSDSLVTSAPGGVEVWFTLARNATAADGSVCVDRTLEIRRDGKRIPVPLLYTGAAPRLVNDSTIRATLSDRCRPSDAYLVDLRTGRPVRERQ
ncbi:MAG: hypothetical protein ACJ8DC_11280 [Gemmatimonadales bacterium]